MPNSLLRFKKNTGNTLSEYTLIAFLVLVLLITAFATIGKGLNTSLLGLKTEFKTRVSSAQEVEDRMTAAFDEQNPDNPEAAFTRLNCDPLVRTRCVIHTEPPESVGANGGEVELSFIEQIFAMFRRLGILPPKDPEALVKELAKRGHQVAFLEEIWEKISKYGDKEQNKLRNIDIMIGDKKYNVKELSDMLKSLSDGIEENQQDIQFSNLEPSTIEEVITHSETIQENAETTSTEANQQLEEEIVTDTAPPGTIPPPSPPPAEPATTTEHHSPEGGTEAEPSRSEETRDAANSTCRLADPNNPPAECIDERPNRRNRRSSSEETDQAQPEPQSAEVTNPPTLYRIE